MAGHAGGGGDGDDMVLDQMTRRGRRPTQTRANARRSIVFLVRERTFSTVAACNNNLGCYFVGSTVYARGVTKLGVVRSHSSGALTTGS